MDFLIDPLILERTPVLVLSPNYIIEQWNPTLCELYGWSASEVLGKDARQLLHTVFPAPFDEIERQFLENRAWRGQLTQTKKDGSQIVVASYWVPHLDLQGQPLAILEFIQDISKYIQAQEALRESEAKFRDLFENSGVPISQALPDGRLIVANAAYAHMYGYDNPQEMMAEVPSADLLYANSKDREDILQILKEKNVCESRETVVKHRDGKLLYVLTNVRAIRDSSGNLICYQAEHIDITERKQIEEKLRQAERFTQATIDALPTHVCVLDENGTILSINRAWRDFADANGGADPNYSMGVNYLAVCDSAQGKDSEGASAFAEGIRKVIRHEIDQYSLEYTCDSPLENRWFIASVTRFKGQELERLVISHINITERKRSELLVSQLTNRYRDLFENSGTNIAIIDENGKYLMVNRGVAENFGVAPEEIIGKSMVDFLPLKTANKYLEFNRQLLKTGGHREYEDTFSLPTSQKTFLVIDQCLQDENSRNFAVQSSSIDISERKKIEEGLRESRERLSRLSCHLVETQEQERRRVARELHDEIGQTLTALTISLNAIPQTALDEPISKKIDVLKALTGELMNQVNTLSSELRPRVLDDLGLVPGLISLFNRLTTQTGIEIDFKHGLFEPKQITPEIEITAYRIIQEALTNIIRHAIVKLAIVRIQIDENALWIQVQDEGKGFDYPSAMKSGSSMGLTSMLERAELVGGEFSIQTAPGEGTIITCRLPLGEGYVERRKYARN